MFKGVVDTESCAAGQESQGVLSPSPSLSLSLSLSLSNFCQPSDRDRGRRTPKTNEREATAAAQAQWPLIEIFSRTFSQGMSLDRFDRPDVVSRRERERGVGE